VFFKTLSEGSNTRLKYINIPIQPPAPIYINLKLNIARATENITRKIDNKISKKPLK
jgi:hypothetical protein